MGLNVTEKKRKRQEAAAVEAVAKAARVTVLETSDRGVLAEQELAVLSTLPSIVVFDLDDTLWVGDIDMTTGPPFRTDGRGLPVLAKVGGHGDKVVPFPHVPEVFDWLEANSIKAAVSTHSWKPEWAAEVLDILETSGGTKFSDLLVAPIGKEVQKKSKDVHLKALAAASGCACEDMVFFDDKDHNVKDGRKAGVVSCTVTSEGLTWDKFVQCLRDFEQKRTGNAESSAPLALAPQTVAPKARAAVHKAAWATPGYGAAMPKAQGWRPAWASRPQAADAQCNPQLAALAAQMGLLGPNGHQWSTWGPY